MKRVYGAIAVLALATSVLAAPANADVAYISPDGRTIAFAGEASDPVPERRQIRVVDADCLFKGKARADCGRIVFEGAGIPKGKIVWAKDSTSFIRSGASRLWFRKIEGAGEQPQSLWGQWPIDSTVFDPDLFPGRDQRPTELVDADLWEQRISNARGEPIGQIVDDGETTTLAIPSGPRLEIPPEIAWIAPLTPRKYQVGASAWTDEVYFWSASMGRNGLLQRFSSRGVQTIDLPEGVAGPATPVWDVATGEPVALLDPFAIHPLALRAKELTWLERPMRQLRDSDQSLEFTSVSVTLGAQTAVVRAIQGLTCTKTYLVRPDAVRFVDRVCREKAKDLGAPTVSPVEIPGAGYALKGRLYSWAKARPASGLLLVFGGGPQSNSTQVRPWTAGEALGDNFDLLIVDYRGSVGFGWENLTALRQPLSDVAAEDLRAAAKWAASVPAYSDKTLGFWGDSWGGYAGALALTREITSFDFIVSNSGFIENPEVRRERCSSGWFRLLLGTSSGDNPKCNGAQLMQEVPRVATPMLMLVGEKDLQTEPSISRAWAETAKASGACIGTIYSTSGGHTLQWPEEPRSAALNFVRDWVDHARSGRREACELNVVLP